MDDKNAGLAANNAFTGMLRSQLLATVVVALAAYIISGMHAGLSALAGGMSVVMAAVIASRVAVSKRKDAASVLGSMLKAELIKIFLIILFLYLTITRYEALVPLALVAGLAAAAIISGASISKRSKQLDS